MPPSPLQSLIQLHRRVERFQGIVRRLGQTFQRLHAVGEDVPGVTEFLRLNMLTAHTAAESLDLATQQLNHERHHLKQSVDAALARQAQALPIEGHARDRGSSAG